MVTVWASVVSVEFAKCGVHGRRIRDLYGQLAVVAHGHLTPLPPLRIEPTCAAAFRVAPDSDSWHPDSWLQIRRARRLVVAHHVTAMACRNWSAGRSGVLRDTVSRSRPPKFGGDLGSFCLGRGGAIYYKVWRVSRPV